jgi:hypothetical protein
MNNRHESSTFPVIIDNETGFILDETTEELFYTENNAKKTSNVLADFVSSYSQHKNQQYN